MNKDKINQLEFEKFRRELISCIEQLTMEDNITLIIDYGESTICKNCGLLHKGTRCLSNADIAITFLHSKLLARKAAEQLLGIDNNGWGKPKEN